MMTLSMHAHQIIILNPTRSPDVENKIVHGGVSNVKKRDANEPGRPVLLDGARVRAFPPVHQGCCNVVHLKVMALCPCACVPGMSTPPLCFGGVRVFAGGRAHLPCSHS